MAKYIDDDELVYEIILSKGKGFLTDKAAMMMILIAKNLSRRFHYYNKIESIEEDCHQSGLVGMLLFFIIYNSFIVIFFQNDLFIYDSIFIFHFFKETHGSFTHSKAYIFVWCFYDIHFCICIIVYCAVLTCSHHLFHFLVIIFYF